jgi:hypothetical protein
MFGCSQSGSIPSIRPARGFARAHTAQVSRQNGSTGAVLIEVYEMP